MVTYCIWHAITVLDDGHGNRKFTLFLKEMLGNCDTEVVDGEADGDALHLLESERMKERGNQYFQRQDLTSAIR